MTEATSQDDEGGFLGEYGDRNNNWRLRSNFMVRWTKGDWGATWFTRYYSRQEEECPFDYNDYGFGELCNDFDNDVNKIGGTTYHDASLFWKAPWNAKITVGVNNVLRQGSAGGVHHVCEQLRSRLRDPGPFRVHAVQPEVLIGLPASVIRTAPQGAVFFCARFSWLQSLASLQT